MQNSNTLILAIESSCDDTSCAVLRGNEVLSNIVSSQKVHAAFGGVVPELASRDHEKNIVPVVQEALAAAGIKLGEIQAVTVTRGPGLMGSLLVGLSFAKSLSLALNIPLIEVNHMQAHVLAHFIKSARGEYPRFPFLCLTVSGGHTQLVVVHDHLKMEVVGQTIDDAVGEAFDKAAKVLGLPYPGGPLIDRYAKEGDKNRFTFSESRVPGYDYSFSGVKTSFLYFIRDHVKADEHFIKNNLNDICASYQHHLVSLLIKNVRRVLRDKEISDLALAGGVSVNSELRSRVRSLAEELNLRVFIPEPQYCTDNAAMIGIAGLYKFRDAQFSGLDITPQARMAL
jgi:N6-L-threonylcarbamoyladenine synthase